ncbi:hypothetical protein G7046_g3255 [Stylonectria norvegica]|nr:hypothetical protein G7046_g3255 [Stylonectria norvegica]
MYPLKFLALFCSLATVSAIPVATPPIIKYHAVPDGYCCFTLRDAKTNSIVRQQTANGFMYVGSNEPEGWYCIDLANPQKILRDQFYNACFIAPDGLFICYDQLPGPNLWTLKKSGADTLLLHDGVTTYKKRPADIGGGKWLYGNSDSSSATFETTSLKAQDWKGTCKSFATRDPRGPHLAPAKLDVLNNSVWHRRASSFGAEGMALISENTSTTFYFNLPLDLFSSTGPNSTCGLFFDLPFCSDLPKGYPCFEWSGMAHQAQANSSMAWELVSNAGKHSHWTPGPLIKLVPGERVLAATFDCSQHTSQERIRKIKFRARGLRKWSLRFLQAGVGNDWQDGVGAFIYSCAPKGLALD